MLMRRSTTITPKAATFATPSKTYKVLGALTKPFTALTFRKKVQYSTDPYWIPEKQDDLFSIISNDGSIISGATSDSFDWDADTLSEPAIERPHQIVMTEGWYARYLQEQKTKKALDALQPFQWKKLNPIFQVKKLTHRMVAAYIKQRPGWTLEPHEFTSGYYGSPYTLPQRIYRKILRKDRVVYFPKYTIRRRFMEGYRRRKYCGPGTRRRRNYARPRPRRVMSKANRKRFAH